MRWCPLQLHKDRIIVLVFGVLVIIAFSIYTFSSYSTKPKGGTKVEPVKNVVTTNNSNADLVSSSQDRKAFTKIQ